MVDTCKHPDTQAHSNHVPSPEFKVHWPAHERISSSQRRVVLYDLACAHRTFAELKR